MNEKQFNRENKARILIVDDHSIVRKGLIQLINHESDMVVCGEAENAAKAVVILQREHVDMAIVDISLDGTDGLKLTEKIKLRYPSLGVLILSMHDELFYVKRAFHVGASGYLAKHNAAEKIITAIRQILRGEIYICDRITRKISSKDILWSPGQSGQTITGNLNERSIGYGHYKGKGIVDKI